MVTLALIIGLLALTISLIVGYCLYKDENDWRIFEKEYEQFAERTRGKVEDLAEHLGYVWTFDYSSPSQRVPFWKWIKTTNDSDYQKWIKEIEDKVNQLGEELGYKYKSNARKFFYRTSPFVNIDEQSEEFKKIPDYVWEKQKISIDTQKLDLLLKQLGYEYKPEEKQDVPAKLVKVRKSK